MNSISDQFLRMARNVVAETRVIAASLIGLQKQVETISKQTNPDENPHDKPVPPIASVLTTPAAIKVEAQAHEKKDKWQRVFEIFELLGIAAVVAYSVLTYYQFRELRKSVEASQEAAFFAYHQTILAGQAAKIQAQTARDNYRTMYLGQRAWVAIAVVNNTLVEGKPVFIPLQVGNSGKTAAKHVTGDFILRLYKPSETPDFVYEHRHRMHLASTTVVPNGRVNLSVYAISGPKESPDGSKPLPPTLVTPDTLAQLENGTLIMILYGKLTYDDAWGVKHWITLCTLGGPQAVGGVNFSHPAAEACNKYTDTDESEPSETH